MGTSDFAREILEHLYLKKNFNIKAVYTQPPRKSERGQKINLSAVHKFADEKKIKFFCPSKLSDSDVQNIKKIKPDNLIVVSYGLILPLKIIGIPNSPKEYWPAKNVPAAAKIQEHQEGQGG